MLNLAVACLFVCVICFVVVTVVFLIVRCFLIKVITLGVGGSCGFVWFVGY